MLVLSRYLELSESSMHIYIYIILSESYIYVCRQYAFAIDLALQN